ncbi:alpha/beta hydrolase [Paenibacillus sp. FSL H8-0548]|uniref:alpha/beta fold hydrolase n=1 Tax=Paenibacillus sp. FSL H8-0548 TaxID=1920422 RepID=UPI00096E1423|nr:alpha/beta hydrolase [Paenibacillus sp. FSL H8-0548]OMF23509.1 alpha/beta hydrolase [Paenibacillus sp. FSL H8-0548]
MKIFKSEKGKDQVLNSYNRLLEMWSTEFQEHDVETEYGTTHCITAGSKEKPPLLLLHGVGDNSAVMWALNINEISKHFYCIAVDTMGGPGKSVPNEKFRKNSFNQVEWINQIVDHFNIDNFHIAGVSNGAYMAYNYTTVNSSRVNKVVCMEGGMVTNPLKTMIQTLLMMFPEILLPTNRNLLKILKKLSSPVSKIFDEYPLLAEHLVHLMKNHNQQAMFVHKTVKYDESIGSAVKNKLYFLIGDHRIDIGKHFIEILDKGGFSYKVVPNAGHGINLEQPEIINNELIRFLKQENI